MSRRHRHPFHTEEAEINITPMMDVVFILLIFFIVTASFVKESGIDVQQPAPDSSEEQQKKADSIVIRIDQSNQVCIGPRSIDVRAVTANVQRRLAENPNSAVLIAAHPKSQVDYLVQVMDQIKLAGVSNIVPRELGAQSEGCR